MLSFYENSIVLRCLPSEASLCDLWQNICDLLVDFIWTLSDPSVRNLCHGNWTVPSASVPIVACPLSIINIGHVLLARALSCCYLWFSKVSCGCERWHPKSPENGWVGSLPVAAKSCVRASTVTVGNHTAIELVECISESIVLFYWLISRSIDL